MEAFWNSIARYNAETWFWQAAFILIGCLLLLRMRLRPGRTAGNALKIYLVLLNGWIAVVYYLVYGGQRSYPFIFALVWGLLALLWAHDLYSGKTTFERTGRNGFFSALLCLLPFVFPLVSLARGQEFPMLITPVMPCSVAVFTMGLLLRYVRKVDFLPVFILCQWTILGVSKISLYRLPEDLLLIGGMLPALYFLLREYAKARLTADSKPTLRTMNVLLSALFLAAGALFLADVIREVL